MRLLYLISLVFTALAAAGCNTTEGFGKDVEAAGEEIEDIAKDAEDDER